MTHIVVLVLIVHASFTFLLRDDFTGVLHDDLIGLEIAVAPDTVATVRSLDHFNTNTILATLAATCCQISKGAIVAMLLSDVAVVVIAFVKHDSVLAVVAAAIFRATHTLGVVEGRDLAPVIF